MPDEKSILFSIYNNFCLYTTVPVLLTSERKALFFPILAVVYPSSNDLLHQVLRIGALNRLGVLQRAIRHVCKNKWLLLQTRPGTNKTMK